MPNFRSQHTPTSPVFPPSPSNSSRKSSEEARQSSVDSTEGSLSPLFGQAPSLGPAPRSVPASTNNLNSPASPALGGHQAFPSGRLPTAAPLLQASQRPHAMAANSEVSPELAASNKEASGLLFRRRVEKLATRLEPLLSVTTAQPHPAFPRTLLHYHLLTEAQLDELAHHYHQRTPSRYSLDYPAPVVQRWTRSGKIDDKRRRFGRFAGLKGCDSPAFAVDRAIVVGRDGNIAMNETEEDQAEREWAEVRRWVENRIRSQMEQEREREMRRQKGF